MAQLPMRLVTQKNTQRKNNNTIVQGSNRNNQGQYNQTLMNGMMQIGSHGQV